MKFKANRESDSFAAADEVLTGKNPSPEKALPLLLQARSEGDLRAAYALGTWYLHGQGDLVAIDVARGLDLIREAAEVNIPNALYDLAVSAEIGDGCAKDEARALSLYLRAALRGESQSVYEVGRCYYYGIGTAEDKQVAQVWFDRAAEFGIDDHEEGKH